MGLFRRKKDVPAPTARAIVLILVLVLLFYFILLGEKGAHLIGEPNWALKILGVAVFVFPLIGVGLVVAELRFGIATQIMGETLVEEGADPEPELPLRPSGRPEREAADALFAERQKAVEAAPDDWRNWYRLSLAYDYSGDRRRAREAMRTAITKCELLVRPAKGP